jgi:hypothetical protein
MSFAGAQEPGAEAFWAEPDGDTVAEADDELDTFLSVSEPGATEVLVRQILAAMSPTSAQHTSLRAIIFTDPLYAN